MLPLGVVVCCVLPPHHCFLVRQFIWVLNRRRLSRRYKPLFVVSLVTDGGGSVNPFVFNKWVLFGFTLPPRFPLSVSKMVVVLSLLVVFPCSSCSRWWLGVLGFHFSAACGLLF
ncbi:hypothetical protein QL285_079369 [Trifolium repens]|nr:hypothetical protein QL285_079369 [Trifolium repens]